MRTLLLLFALAVSGLASGCTAFWAVVDRPPTVCEKLCDFYYRPSSLSMATSPTQCYCEYTDMMAPKMNGRPGINGPEFAHLTCTPDCATAAAKLK